MPLLPEQLMLPNGYLDPAQFLPRVLATDLEAWITEGESLTTGLSTALQDKAVMAWAYYRARKYQVEMLCGDPAKMTVDSGRSSREYTQEQIDEFRKERDFWKGQFDTLTLSLNVSQSSAVAVVQRSNRVSTCHICGLSPCRHSRFYCGR